MPTLAQLSCLIFGYIRHREAKKSLKSEEKSDSIENNHDTVNDQITAEKEVRILKRPPYISYFDPIIENLNIEKLPFKPVDSDDRPLVWERKMFARSDRELFYDIDIIRNIISS